jgi:hypothetical protein
MIAKDTPARIQMVVSAMLAVIASKGPRHLASIKAIRSIIGVLIFMVRVDGDSRRVYPERSGDSRDRFHGLESHAHGTWLEY